MASSNLKFVDKLDDASNSLSCKERVKFLLEENDLWDIVKNVATLPTNPQKLVAQNKRVVKAKKISWMP
jgi:hypothetical protein